MPAAAVRQPRGELDPVAAQPRSAQIDLKGPLPVWLRHAAGFGCDVSAMLILQAQPVPVASAPAQAHPAGESVAATIETTIQAEILRYMRSATISGAPRTAASRARVRLNCGI